MIDLFDAAGFSVVIVESVGAGQAEVEITRYADTRVVVCPPGLGDDVQAIKVGVLEIGRLPTGGHRIPAGRDGAMVTRSVLLPHPECQPTARAIVGAWRSDRSISESSARQYVKRHPTVYRPNAPHRPRNPGATRRTRKRTG